MIEEIPGHSISFDKKFQSFCKLPFYGHKKGCPNYGKKKGCPPNQPLITDLFDMENEIYVIYTEFPVGEFAQSMLARHPEWSQRMAYNPRYWQPKARKIHNQEISGFLFENSEMAVTRSPEAHGVDVSRLMNNIGIELRWEWPPSCEEKTYLVSMAGYTKITGKS